MYPGRVRVDDVSTRDDGAGVAQGAAPWRAAQGHHEIGDRPVKRGSVPEFVAANLGAISLVPFFGRAKKGTSSGAADVVSML